MDWGEAGTEYRVAMPTNCPTCREPMFKWDDADSDPITGVKPQVPVHLRHAGHNLLLAMLGGGDFSRYYHNILEALPRLHQRFLWEQMCVRPNPEEAVYNGFRRQANFQRYGRDWRDWGRKLNEAGIPYGLIYHLIKRSINLTGQMVEGGVIMWWMECSIAERNGSIWSVSMRPWRNIRRRSEAGRGGAGVWFESQEVVPYIVGSK